MQRYRRGFTLMELLIVVAIIMVIASIAVTQGPKVLMYMNEAAAIKAIKTIQEAQQMYYSTYGNNGKFAASLAELGPSSSGQSGPGAAGLIHADLASGTKSGYMFTVQGDQAGYTVHAKPVNYNRTGRRTFYSSQDMEIRQHWGSEPAKPDSELVK